MLKKHVQLRIHDLLDEGLAVSEVAQRTGASIATIYNYKRDGRKLKGGPRLDKDEYVPLELLPFKEIIDYRAKGKIKQNTLFFMLQKQGYKGSRLAFDNYYQKRKRELQPQRVVRHIESEPGEQAQVDWGHFGEITINGKREKVYLFAYILSWSRATYFEFVVRQNQRTLQTCHIHAFEKLGIPKMIVYDNMKTVVNRREKLADGQVKVRFNLAFQDFARYYKFEVFASPPYWPRTKGKVESSISYVRNYFSRVTPSINITLEELNMQLMEWTEKHANQRIHGTTHVKPYTRWLEEKSLLSFPTNVPVYNSTPMRTYYTTQYGLLIRSGVTYNLGPEYARLKLEVRETQDHGLPFLEIYRKNQLIFTVPVPSQGQSWVSVVEQKHTTESKSEVLPKAQQTPEKKLKPYDIDVEQRDLSYYGLSGLQFEGVNHG